MEDAQGVLSENFAVDVIVMLSTSLPGTRRLGQHAPSSAGTHCCLVTFAALTVLRQDVKYRV